MPGVFISYRREDSAADAGRLFEHLKRCCRTEVYLDISGTQAGAHFPDVLAARLEACDAVLVLIGPRWSSSQDTRTGRRRLDDPRDFVRFEIATAIGRGKTLIPVLLPGGALPHAEELSKDIQELVWREAVDIRHAHWLADVNALVAQLPPEVRCTQCADDVAIERWPMFALFPTLLITALHSVAAIEIDFLPTEVFSIGLSLVVGVVNTLNGGNAVRTRVILATAIAFGATLLASIVVPFITKQSIIPDSLAPVRLAALFAAEIAGGYLAGSLIADVVRALGRKRRGA